MSVRALIMRAIDAIADGEIDFAVELLWAAIDEIPDVAELAPYGDEEPALEEAA